MLFLFLDEKKPVKLSFTIQKAPERKKEVTAKAQNKPKRTPKKVTEENKTVIIPDKFLKIAKKFGLPEEHLEFFYENRESFHWESQDKNIIHCAEPTCKLTMKPSKDCLVEHMIAVHHYSDIPCDRPHCGYIAYSQKSLNIHKIHFHGIPRRRPSKRAHVPCPYPNCKAYFEGNANLQTHLNIHENRGFSCNFCPYRIGTKRLISNHLNIHFNIRNYICDTCPRAFVNKDDLKKHHSIFHSTAGFDCVHCEFSASKINRLQDHTKICKERLKYFETQ